MMIRDFVFSTAFGARGKKLTGMTLAVRLMPLMPSIKLLTA